MKSALAQGLRSLRHERLRLLLGIGTVTLLAGYLAVDRGWLATNHSAQKRQPAAVIPASLPSISKLDAEQWRQAASDAGIQPETVEYRNSAWYIQGITDSSESLAALSRWAARRGWWAIDWEIQHDHPRTRLKVRYVAELETLDPETLGLETSP